jgi:hypothetical protein
MSSSDLILAADEKLFEAVDTYIPTPNADGTCTPEIVDADDGCYYVVCADCEVYRTCDEQVAKDLLDSGECSGGASS